VSTLLYSQQHAASPSDETHVRSTVTVVSHDDPPAVSDHAPEFNEHETDPDTAGGLTTRQLGSHVIPSVRYPPAIGNADENLFKVINEQVSSSGTAAARELTGQWGHGTLKVVEGIEPTIRDGDQFGADYFVSTPRPDAGSGSQLTPSQPADPDTLAAAQATGIANARAAYGAFYAAQTGM
jgi:hypothetical protein